MIFLIIKASTLLFMRLGKLDLVGSSVRLLYAGKTFTMTGPSDVRLDDSDISRWGIVPR